PVAAAGGRVPRWSRAPLRLRHETEPRRSQVAGCRPPRNGYPSSCRRTVRRAGNRPRDDAGQGSPIAMDTAAQHVELLSRSRLRIPRPLRLAAVWTLVLVAALLLVPYAADHLK